MDKKISRRFLLANGLAAAGSVFVAIANAKGKTLLSLTAPKATLDVAALQSKIKGQALVQTDPDFKKMALDGLWNELRPDRLPQMIVRVQEEEDVVEAIKYARANKMKVVVRGGGHNWCNPSLRNGGMMIDLTNLNKVISIDVEGRKAVVQPIISNREIQQHLNAKGMSFPSGHCPQVKLSGYLLGGGMSWNQATWGPGVGSVEAIEMVTAKGERILANATQNSDYFWAARGAGSGFFAVALRYHLKLYPLPKAITASSYFYPLDEAPAVADWLSKLAPSLDPKIELSLFVLQAPLALAEQSKKDVGKVCLVTATCFAETPEEGQMALKPFDTYAEISKCLSKTIAQPMTFEQLFDSSGAMWPEHLRNRVQAMFSDSNAKDVFAAMTDHFKLAPSPISLALFAIFTGPNVPAKLPDAAFSMTARLYGGPWTMWKDPADDAANTKWHDELVAKLMPYIIGTYVSESDTVRDPDHGKSAYTPSHWKRLAELRAKHDPDRLFFAFADGLG